MNKTGLSLFCLAMCLTPLVHCAPQDEETTTLGSSTLGSETADVDETTTTSTTPAVIIKQINEINDDGSYTVGYEAADGTFKMETRDIEGNVNGKYGFLDENGNIKIVEYSSNNSTGFSTNLQGQEGPVEDPAFKIERARQEAALAYQQRVIEEQKALEAKNQLALARQQFANTPGARNRRPVFNAANFNPNAPLSSQFDNRGAEQDFQQFLRQQQSGGAPQQPQQPQQQQQQFQFNAQQALQQQQQFFAQQRQQQAAAATSADGEFIGQLQFGGQQQQVRLTAQQLQQLGFNVQQQQTSPQQPQQFAPQSQQQFAPQQQQFAPQSQQQFVAQQQQLAAQQQQFAPQQQFGVEEARFIPANQQVNPNTIPLDQLTAEQIALEGFSRDDDQDGQIDPLPAHLQASLPQNFAPQQPNFAAQQQGGFLPQQQQASFAPQQQVPANFVPQQPNFSFDQEQRVAQTNGGFSAQDASRLSFQALQEQQQKFFQSQPQNAAPRHQFIQQQTIAETRLVSAGGPAAAGQGVAADGSQGPRFRTPQPPQPSASPVAQPGGFQQVQTVDNLSTEQLNQLLHSLAVNQRQ